MTSWERLLKIGSHKPDIEKSNEDKRDKLTSKHFAGIGIRLMLAICFSLIMTSLALDFSKIEFELLPQIGVTFGVIIFLAAITWFWQAFLILLGLIASVFAVIWATGNLDLELFSKWLEYPSFWFEEAFYWLIVQPNYFPIETLPILGLVLGALIAVGCYWLVARTCHPWFMLLALIGVLFARQALEYNTAFIAAITGFIVVFLAFALKQPGWNRNTRPRLITIQAPLSGYSLLPVLSAVLAAAILAQVVSPAVITAVKRPQHWEDLVSMLTIPGMNGSGPGTEFSIGTAGYYPLNNRLGGSVNLSDEPVFNVSGPDSDMLFKGAVSMNYSGNSWERLPLNYGMGFNDPMYFQTRESVLDLNNYFDGSGALFNGYMTIDSTFFTQEELVELQSLLENDGRLDAGSIESKMYSVEFLKQGFRSVFYHGAPMDVILDLESNASAQGFDLFSELVEFDPTLYFNEGGSIFTTTPFSPGQGYQIVAMDRIINEETFAFWYRAFYGVDTSGLDFNAEDVASSVGDRRYLQVPDLPEYSYNGSLSVLARELIADKRSQYDRAKAIEAYLRASADYSLRVEMPPEDREFVSWFLEQGEGYCVYFATALTMLCRLAGIPARYVEGYYIPAGNDTPTIEGNIDISERTITGQEAHAWTEVYIDGMGWMTMDATPGGGTAAAVQIEQDRNNPYPNFATPTPFPDNIQNNNNNRNDLTDSDNDWSNIIRKFALAVMPFAIALAIALIVLFGLRLWILRLRRLFSENWWLSKSSSIRLRIKLLLTAILRLLPDHDKLWENGQVWSVFADNSRHYIFSISNGSVDAHEWEKASRIFNEALYSDHEMKEKQWKLVWHIFSSMITGLLEKKAGKLRICIKLLPMMTYLKKSNQKQGLL